jgi:hypothetical protein
MEHVSVCRFLLYDYVHSTRLSYYPTNTDESSPRSSDSGSRIGTYPSRAPSRFDAASLSTAANSTNETLVPTGQR